MPNLQVPHHVLRLCLELRSLPSTTALPGFSGTTNLSATHGAPRPVPRGRPVGHPLTTPWGFPCCVRSPCVHAAATTPVQRLGVLFAHLAHPCQPSPNPLSGRPAHRPFRGLLGVHSRCGLHTRTVTKFVTAIRRLQTFRHLHACSRLLPAGAGCRAGLAPAGEAPPCHGARGNRTFEHAFLVAEHRPRTR